MPRSKIETSASAAMQRRRGNSTSVLMVKTARTISSRRSSKQNCSILRSGPISLDGPACGMSSFPRNTMMATHYGPAKRPAARRGNLPIDVGPTADGRIPLLQHDRLLELGNWLAVNDEAIYGSRAWTTAAQWTEGERPAQEYKQYRQEYDILQLAGLDPEGGMARKIAFFTRKHDDLYAIVPGYPQGALVLEGVKASAEAKVTMLGLPGELAWTRRNGDLVISVPAMTPEELPCGYAYAFKIEPGTAANEHGD